MWLFTYQACQGREGGMKRYDQSGQICIQLEQKGKKLFADSPICHNYHRLLMHFSAGALHDEQMNSQRKGVCSL